MQRRQLLRTVALAGTVGLAGCTEGGVDAGAGGAGSPTATETPTPTATPGSGGTPEPTPEPTANPTETATAEPTDSATETPASVGAPSLGDIGVAFESNYRFSVDTPDFDGTIDGEWDGGNFVSRVTVDGDTMESYFVEGDTYIVADGSCTKVPNSPGGTGVDVEELAGTDETEENVEQYETFESTGTATIDGESMVVFELASAETDLEADVTYYVNPSTRRLRRVVTQGVTIDYSDWGQVDEITPPC